MTMAAMPSEPTQALLLELLGIPRLDRDGLEAAAQGADWDRLVALAGPGLQPLLAHRLIERRLAVPAPVQHRLLAAQRGSAALLTHRRAALREALTALDSASVPCAVLKGFALAHLVYPRPETRVMSDVDLWVGAGSLHAAIAALGPLGWHIPWWRNLHADSAGDGAEVGLRLRSTRLILELHQPPHSLAERIPSELASVWSRRRPVNIGTFRANTLTLEDQLVHLCLHLAAHHRFVGALPPLVDVTLTVAALGPNFPWTSFAGRCVDLGIAGWVAATLATARAMLNAPVTDEGLSAFGIADLNRLSAMAGEQIWLSAATMRSPEGVFAAASPQGRASRLAGRMRDLFVDPAARRGSDGRLVRTFRRLRFAAQVALPKAVGILARGTYRGAEGSRFRELSAANQQLADAMADAGRRTASANAGSGHQR